MPLTDIAPLITEMMTHKLGPETPTHYVLWGATGVDPICRFGRVCHAELEEEDSGTYDELVTRTGDLTPQNIKYLEALLKGPFANYSHLVTIHEPGFVHIEGLDEWPANVLFNFCVATRYGAEFPTLIEKAGATDNPIEALWAAKEAGRTPINFSVWHSWFNPREHVLENILLGRMNNVTDETYKQAPAACIPADIIWSDQIES